MGMFDDLIPQGQAAPQGGGMFDDLIPNPTAPKAAQPPAEFQPQSPGTQRIGGRAGYADVPQNDPNVDWNTGASTAARIQVGSSPTQDRLANVQRFYPDARPMGQDNFVFTNPDTGKLTAYNPPGLDRNDVPSVAKEVTQATGAGLAGTAAALGSIPTGGLAAPVAVPVAAGAGSVAGGNIFDALMQLFGGQVNTKTLPAKMIDSATDFGLEGAAGGVASAAGQAARNLGPRGARLVKAVIGGPNAGQRLQDIEAVGVTPTAGLVSDRRMTQGATSALSNVPSSAGVMQDTSQRTVNELDTAATNLANRYAGGQAATSKETAGANLKAGAQNAADRFNQRTEALYNTAYGQIGRDTPTQLPNVTRLRQEVGAALQSAPNSQPALAGAVRQLDNLLQDAAANNGTIPFETLRNIRTAIGRDLDNPVLAGSSGSQNDQMRRIYAALTDDLNATAGQNPQAGRMLEQANRYVRFNQNQNIPLLQKIRDAGTDEQAFNIAVSGARDGGTNLRRLRRNLTPQEWDVMSGSVLGRMGLAKPGAQDAAGEVFSPTTFLTNWNTMSPEAKAALFSGTRYAQLRPQLDQLARVVDFAKGTEKLANTSGTARHMIYIQLLGGTGLGIASPTAGVASVAAPWSAAKLLTNPRFARWLASASRPDAVLRPNGVAANLARLKAQLGKDPDIGNDVQSYIDAVANAEGNQDQQNR